MRFLILSFSLDCRKFYRLIFDVTTAAIVPHLFFQHSCHHRGMVNTLFLRYFTSFRKIVQIFLFLFAADIFI